jgi:DNA-binding transcriptional LysR family regulator
MIALPAAHPLARLDAVSLADLAGQAMLRYDTAPEHEAGRPSQRGGIRTIEEKLEAVALGHGLALVPATAAAYYQRPDITYRPVTEAQPYQVALATITETARRPEARAFVKTALAISAGNAGAPGPK